MDALAASLLTDFNSDSFLYLLDILNESSRIDTQHQDMLSDFMRSVTLKACQWNNAQCLELLLHCATEFFTHDIAVELVQECIFAKSWNCAQLLIPKIANINLCSVVQWFVLSEFESETFELFIQRGFQFSTCPCGGHRAIISAILSNNFALVKACLSNGCSVGLISTKTCETVDVSSFSKHQPITVAIYNKNPDIVRLLLTYGADINLADDINDVAMTPLCLASSLAYSDIIIELISAYSKQVGLNFVTLAEYYRDINEAILLLMPLEICDEWKFCFNQLLAESTKNANFIIKGYSLLVSAAEKNNTYALTSLLQNCCTFRKLNRDFVKYDQDALDVFSLPSSITGLHDDTFNIAIKAGIAVSDVELPIADDKRVSTIRRSMKLSDWSRVAVRRSVRRHMLGDLQTLNIPQLLIEFINFRSLV